MANSLSSKKRVRQNEKRRLINRTRNSATKTQMKKFYTGITEHADLAQMETEMQLAQKKVHQLAAHGIIHKKNASRKIARMARVLNAAKAKTN